MLELLNVTDLWRKQPPFNESKIADYLYNGCFAPDEDEADYYLPIKAVTIA